MNTNHILSLIIKATEKASGVFQDFYVVDPKNGLKRQLVILDANIFTSTLKEMMEGETEDWQKDGMACPHTTVASLENGSVCWACGKVLNVDQIT